MSKRIEQLTSVVHRAVQAVLSQGLSDPRVSGALITATGVSVSPDLRAAIVRVTVTPESAISRVMHGLEAAAPHVRHRAADQVNLRRFPDLSFRLDKGAMRQAEVLDALARVRAENERNAAAAEGIQPSSESLPNAESPEPTVAPPHPSLPKADT